MSKGLIRVAHVDPTKIADMIPVDCSCNLMIAAAWDTATQKRSKDEQQITVYHSTTGAVNPATWSTFKEYGLEGWHKYPDPQMMWQPSIALISNYFWFRINSIVFHMLPAYVIDLLSALVGRKPRLVRVEIDFEVEICLRILLLLFTGAIVRKGGQAHEFVGLFYHPTMAILEPEAVRIARPDVATRSRHFLL